MSADIAVIIPARNAARDLEETLQSLSAQSHAGFEAVVVNDGSSDATPQMAEAAATRDPRFRMLNGPASGVSAARNTGLAATSSPYVLFLDADDLLPADALERLRTALGQSGAVASLGRIARIAEDGAPLPGNDNLALMPSTGQLEALLRKNFVVNGGALLIRRDAIDRAGGYDPTLAYGEDWEFWCRLAALGDFTPTPGGPVLQYRQRADGANYRARGSVFARDVPCLDRIAENRGIAERIGPALRRLLRARRIDIFWSGVRSEFQFGAKTRALALAAGGLLLYPDTVARPQLAMRFVRSLYR
ncbi:MAG: glycosyltransferase family 2 protein [Pseudomonadota bacterium]